MSYATAARGDPPPLALTLLLLLPPLPLPLLLLPPPPPAPVAGTTALVPPPLPPKCAHTTTSPSPSCHFSAWLARRVRSMGENTFTRLDGVGEQRIQAGRWRT